MRKNSANAFTLVEMIVSLGIFAVVAVVALGALVRIINANQKAQTLEAAMTNLSAALDAMSRELRVGSVFYCRNVSATSPYTFVSNGVLDYNFQARPCDINNISKIDPNQATVLAFISSRVDSTNSCNLATVYRFVTGSDGRLRLQKAEQSVCGTPVGQRTSSDSDFSDLLSPAITLDDYGVGVINSGSYPLVFLRLIGHAGVKEISRTDFDVQTSVSSRIPQY